MIITTVAAASVFIATFTIADEPHLSAGFGIEGGEGLAIHFDYDGNVTDVTGDEMLNDDRALNHLCDSIADYFADRGVPSAGRNKHTVTFSEMLDYLEDRHGSCAA